MSKKIALPSHLNLSKNPETGQDEYYCTPCKRIFRSRTHKYYHYNCNNKEGKKHKCEHCEQRFSTRSHLNYHLENHRNATYQCNECQKSFSNRLVYKKHCQTHQPENVFVCSYCPKQFRSKTSLAAHKARHENYLKFQCSECDKKYATKSALEQHKLKHAAKKHSCPHCGKHFQRNTILNVHMKRHKQNELFKCKICSKKLSDACSLQRHAKTHNTDEIIKYKCNECDAITSRKDNIQRHLRNMHIGMSFEKCIEIIRPSKPPLDEVSCLNKDPPHKLSEEADLNEPKTVANSSVIKFIGRVEPVVVVEPSVPVNIDYDESHSNVNLDECRTLKTSETVKSKLGHKKYDPIEMYRKILNTDDDRDDEATERNANVEDVDHCEPAAAMAKPTSNNATSNFSAMHWRKNFKHTYTQHQGY